MKKTSLILLFTFIVSTFIFGQDDNKLIYPKSNNKTKSTNAKIHVSKYQVNTASEFIEIELNKLKDLELFSLQFDDKSYSVKKDKIKIRDVNNFSFIAKNENDDGNIILNVLGNDIQGIITKGLDLYRISTTENGAYVLTKIDQSKYPEEDCGNFLNDNNHTNKKSGNTNDIYNSDDATESSAISNSTLLKSSALGKCKIRVLVLYTSNAETGRFIHNTIQLAADVTNQSFENSDIAYEIEIVYVGRANYSEDEDIHTDLKRFTTDGDGYMDEVHDLRNAYSADVCVLIIESPVGRVCGVANKINASEDEAFCVVDCDCATGYYSFAHEIGHLVGCRHDTYLDDKRTPFAYGHGYVNLRYKWRTIMAYNDKCKSKGTSCTRLPYWSNPNIEYKVASMPGPDWIAPMGTKATENCARVWNKRAPDVMAFRQLESDIELIEGDILLRSKYADVVASRYITTSNGFTVFDGVELNLHAGESITFGDGFHAKLGSEITTYIEIADCTPTKSAQITLETDDNVKDSIEVTDENISYNIYPNPSFETVNIKYELNATSNVSITLIDFLGKNVKSISTNENQKSGNYNVQCDVTDLASGLYFIRFIINNKSFTEKIIVK